MENGWNLFNNESGGSRGHNGNCTSFAWGEIWELGSSRFDWNSSHNLFNQEATATASAATTATTTTMLQEESEAEPVMFFHPGNDAHHSFSSSSSPTIYDGSRGSHYHPDPHLTCLKLGKRNYFEDATPPVNCHVAGLSITKKGKPYYTGSGGGGGGGGRRDAHWAGPSTSASVTVAVPATVPRCQVEGCHVALVNAKDYHRRHKVCELHSKAPKVLVLGLEQRFCQQCSRFHVVSEFDDAKRSCRRRLAGHNERRRKSSHDHSLARNSSQGRALSLLSSKNDSWTSSADLSSRCSDALRELIAEHRAAILATQLILERDWHSHHSSLEDNNRTPTASNSLVHHQTQMLADPPGWERFNGAGAQVTLDLMQAPNSAFGFLSVRGRSEKEEEDCSDLCSSFGGAHVVWNFNTLDCGTNF